MQPAFPPKAEKSWSQIRQTPPPLLNCQLILFNLFSLFPLPDYPEIDPSFLLLQPVSEVLRGEKLDGNACHILSKSMPSTSCHSPAVVFWAAHSRFTVTLACGGNGISVSGNPPRGKEGK